MGSYTVNNSVISPSYCSVFSELDVLLRLFFPDLIQIIQTLSSCLYIDPQLYFQSAFSCCDIPEQISSSSAVTHMYLLLSK